MPETRVILEPCSECQGSGEREMTESPCEECYGTGNQAKSYTLRGLLQASWNAAFDCGEWESTNEIGYEFYYDRLYMLEAAVTAWVTELENTRNIPDDNVPP